MAAAHASSWRSGLATAAVCLASGAFGWALAKLQVYWRTRKWSQSKLQQRPGLPRRISVEGRGPPLQLLSSAAAVFAARVTVHIAYTAPLHNYNTLSGNLAITDLPLVTLDLETTGLSVASDRIIEVSESCCSACMHVCRPKHSDEQCCATQLHAQVSDPVFWFIRINRSRRSSCCQAARWWSRARSGSIPRCGYPMSRQRSLASRMRMWLEWHLRGRMWRRSGLSSWRAAASTLTTASALTCHC